MTLARYKQRLIRRKLRDDLGHYSGKCLVITTKEADQDAPLVPLEMNRAQEYIDEKLDDQLENKGRVRALILKGRQQGCSTYVQARYFHKVTHRFGINAFILTHLDQSTSTIFDMAKRFYDNIPRVVRPFRQLSNAKELMFSRLSSGYKVATAGSKDVGRSGTIHFFHGSEVAFWPNAKRHMAGVLQAVPNSDDTEIILESTSAGPTGLFYERFMQAWENPGGEWMAIFVPWYWSDEYRLPIPRDFRLTEEEIKYAQLHELDKEQIVWRRSKIFELGSVAEFRREYPATVEEAFRVTIVGALWSQEVIDRNRITVEDFEENAEVTRCGVGLDPSASSNERSNKAGIIAGAKGFYKGKPCKFVLADSSLVGTPNRWATKAISCMEENLADFIVAEKNQGGEMVTAVIHGISKEVPVKLVSATKGKYTRAEPISLESEQDQIKFVGFFPELEDQLTTWVPGDDSPDSLDAMVWIMTELNKAGTPLPSGDLNFESLGKSSRWREDNGR